MTKTIKSDIFRYSDALENEFKRELRRELVAPMIKETTKTILDLYRKSLPMPFYFAFNKDSFG